MIEPIPPLLPGLKEAALRGTLIPFIGSPARDFDFDAMTLDPSTGNMKAEYLPNSQFTELPWDYLHPNHAGYTAMGEVIDLSFFASHHH